MEDKVGVTPAVVRTTYAQKSGQDRFFSAVKYPWRAAFENCGVENESCHAVSTKNTGVLSSKQTFDEFIHTVFWRSI